MMCKEKLVLFACALACANFLSACATVPAPKIVTREVLTPVPVRCIDPALIPAEPGAIALPSDARLAADTAASQALKLRGWGRQLMALISPCTIEGTN